MKFLRNMINGLVIGISNIIPGLSGGTLAVSLGIYDELIHTVTHIKTEFKKSLRLLIPLVVGLAIGVIFFSRSINFLVDNYPVQTALTFTGLIFGGIPILWKEFQDSLSNRKSSINFLHWIIFILLFAVVTWMGVADVSGNGSRELTMNASTFFGIFLVGMIASAAMVIPGISGSLIMLIIGWYQPFLLMINNFVDAVRSMDVNGLLTYGVYCVVFGIGMLVGIGLISKLIDLLFKHFPGHTYAGIFGLVLASPIAIFFNLTPESISLDFVTILVSLILAVTAFLLTFMLGKQNK